MAMLKRKRSDSEMSSSSMLSSSPSFSRSMDMNNTSPFSKQHYRETTPSHLSSRTMKRHRDNRPSEDMIHKNTLSILFNAQKNTSISPIPSPFPQSSLPVQAVQPQPAQSSLHSFWAIPSRPCGSPSSSSSTPPPFTSLANSSSPISANLYHIAASHCEDCNCPLVSPDADVDMMNMDIDVRVGGGDYACESCGKQVCGGCAVSNMGMQRRCLMCAGRKTWVGGLGWVNGN